MSCNWQYKFCHVSGSINFVMYLPEILEFNHVFGSIYICNLVIYLVYCPRNARKTGKIYVRLFEIFIHFNLHKNG
jgi:hypothetical protein